MCSEDSFISFSSNKSLSNSSGSDNAISDSEFGHDYTDLAHYHDEPIITLTPSVDENIAEIKRALGVTKLNTELLSCYKVFLNSEYGTLYNQYKVNPILIKQFSNIYKTYYEACKLYCKPNTDTILILIYTILAPVYRYNKCYKSIINSIGHCFENIELEAYVKMRQ